MYLWRGIAPEAFEPWFQLVSGLIVIAMAFWMLWRVREDRRLATLVIGHDHRNYDHDHKHGHAHPHGHDETRRIDTGHGVVELSIFEGGVPPHWQVTPLSGGPWQP
jgi:nickel/cobalt transporter (NicO) family protein